MRIPKRTDENGLMVWSNGKGDTYRPGNTKLYDKNFDRIFGKRKIKTWKPGKPKDTQSNTK